MYQRQCIENEGRVPDGRVKVKDISERKTARWGMSLRDQILRVACPAGLGARSLWACLTFRRGCASRGDRGGGVICI